MPRLSSLAFLSFVIAAALSLLAVPATAAAATSMLIKGTVACSGGQPAVGVWIESSAGGSEWANDQSWQYSTSSPYRSYRYFEETVTSPSSRSTISLHVGCGGSPSKWAKDLWSTGFPVGSSGRTINVVCDYNRSSRSTGACSQAPVGRDAGANPYASTSKYCTGGAVAQWYKATGYWPYVSRKRDGSGKGDAKYIDENATSNGFRVSPVPQVRSMVVFNNRAAPYGHVGWVTKVYRSGSRVYFDYIDRNGGRIIRPEGITTDYGIDRTRTGQVWESSGTNQRFVIARAYPK